MLSNSASDREAILAAYDELDAAFDKVLGHSLDVLTHSELLTLQSRMERNLRRAPAVEHRILNRLATEASPTALGGTSLADVLATRLRISKGEARRRIEDAEKLGARTALTGEPLEPLWPNTAAAQARGEIGVEHLKVIGKFFKDLPAHVDYQTREAAEADLARIAVGLGPVQLRQAAERLAYLLDQDGTPPGHAVTAGGTLLPMSDVIRLGSHSHQYLVVFDKHTGEPLYLGRARRTASPGQRIVLHTCPWRCRLPPSHGLVRAPFCESCLLRFAPGPTFRLLLGCA